MTRRGMTLLELVLGLTLLGLIGAIGASTLATLADQRRRIRDANTPVQRSATIRRTILSWLEGAHGAVTMPGASSAGGFQLVDARSGDRDVDELVFATTALSPFSSGDVVIRLYIDRDDATLERGLTADIRSASGAPISRVQLDSSVVELDAHCLTELLGTRRWLPSWISPELLPRAVELRLRAARGDSLSPLLQKPMLAVLEGGR